MFSFIRKGTSVADDRDKERRKKEKKQRKEQQKRERTTGTMSAEELLRLDEVRRSLKLRGRRKEKLPSGITADYSASFFAQLDRDSPVDGGTGAPLGTSLNTGAPTTGGLTQSDSSEASLNSINNQTSKRQTLPPVPPRPPKRGILKGPRLSLTSLNSDTVDTTSLQRNTLQNELIAYQNLPMSAKIQSFESLAMNNQSSAAGLQATNNMNNLLVLTSTSPSAESLTSTNSSFATPPFSLSPIGESQGYHRWSKATNFEDVFLPLPDISPIVLPEARVLTIHRQKGPKNDFGFSLRRAMILEKTDKCALLNGDSSDGYRVAQNGVRSFRAVIFAEPGVVGGPTGLLPGDKLLAVNGVSVETKSREDIIEMIKSSHDFVTVKVQPIAELSELSARCFVAEKGDETESPAKTQYEGGTLRRSASRKNVTAAKTDEQLDAERSWQSPDGELLWIVHRGGFTSAQRSPDDAPQVGKVRVKLLGRGQDNQEIVVDEDDLEKANPPSLDTCEDLAALHYLNEASALHVLRQRYCGNLIHTYAGPSLLIINPMAQLSIYSDKVVALFRGCKNEDMPAHIYSTAQASYRSMLCNRRDHSIVFLGRSGSGKTTSFKHALYYLTLTAGSVNKFLTIEKLNAINIILESFGNAKTCLNQNATRFTQIFSLDFDQSGVIASASIQILLLERNRIGRRVNNEATFHIMYRLVAGVEGPLRKDLLLDTLSETNTFFTPYTKTDDKQKGSSEFIRVCQSFDALGISKQEQKVVWTVLAAIYHLGCAGAVKGGSGSRWQFASASAAQRGATLLGTSVEELSRVTFGQQANSTPTTPRQQFRTPSPTGPSERVDVVGIEALEGLVVGLYTEVFNCITALINKTISTSAHTVGSLLLLDSPGFQNPASTGHQSGATLTDLTHNYLQERLQLLFHNTELVAPRDRYAQEQIELDGYCDSGANPGPIVSLLDKPAQHAMVRTSQTDLREADRRGLLWLLDEEAIYPGSSDESFLERLFTYYSDRESQLLLRKAPGSLQFILHHLQGTNPVLYTASGWLKASRENPVSRCAVTILQESSKDDISSLFVSCRGMGPSAFLGGSIVGIEGSQSLRRASSIRRTFTSGAAGMKRRSVCLQVKFAVDGLVDTFRRTKSRFVHCFLPQHNIQSNEVDVNIPLLRSQLRGSQIIDVVRLYKQGYPEGAPLAEFRRRFGLLGDGAVQGSHLDDVQAVHDILTASEVDTASYRIGPSQVLFRAGVLSQLESRRDDRLTGRVVQLQASCRGYLARKRASRLRVEVMAVRCVQRNVRAFLSVRDWPWWRMLVRVQPLLNVHRTEEELKAKTEELETMRSKFDKLESDRSHLKHENDRLESKLSEMTADLAEEHSTATIASERLDAETAERVRLERELQETQMKNKSIQQTSERLEMELLYARSDLNGAHSDSEDAGSETGDGGGVYKQRYERVSRELEFTKRRLQQQHEDDLEQLVGLKKQLEKKLADAYEEVEEQRQVVGQWKRKVQKLNGEMNDLRLLLEEQSSRNNILEKKQRKFDSETQMLNDEIRLEKQTKERLSREKEVLIAEKFSLEQNLADVRLELELKDERLLNLQQELDEITFGGKTEEEVAQLKKIKNELDTKCRDQEEELDDLAGQVQLLEQTKLRLEMSLENLRKENRREAQQRDEEIEEVRGNAHKKVKALESQLESEHDERTLLLREKHELERRLVSAEEAIRSDRQVDVEVVQRLKRDLKRTKALLRDAQTMLERHKADSPGKAVVRQLRNQLEDSECSRLAAVKAKQTMEGEMGELQASLEEACRLRSEAEDRAGIAHRERTELRGQLEENEEELAEVLKKYRSTVQQLSLEQLSVTEQATRVSELESERSVLKETVAELSSRLEAIETLGDPNSSLQQKRLELRVKELESKLELEQTTRSRLEVQMSRQKEALERSSSEATSSRSKEQLAQDSVRKLQRNLRELRDEYHTLAAREMECIQRRKELEKRVETCEAENAGARADLRLALQRIEDLQAAMQGEISGSENSDSEHDSYSSDGSIESFLANHKTPSKTKQSQPDTSPSISITSGPPYSKTNATSPDASSSFA